MIHVLCGKPQSLCKHMIYMNTAVTNFTLYGMTASWHENDIIIPPCSPFPCLFSFRLLGMLAYESSSVLPMSLYFSPQLFSETHFVSFHCHDWRYIICPRDWRLWAGYANVTVGAVSLPDRRGRRTFCFFVRLTEEHNVTPLLQTCSMLGLVSREKERCKKCCWPLPGREQSHCVINAISSTCVVGVAAAEALKWVNKHSSGRLSLSWLEWKFNTIGETVVNQNGGCEKGLLWIPMFLPLGGSQGCALGLWRWCCCIIPSAALEEHWCKAFSTHWSALSPFSPAFLPDHCLYPGQHPECSAHSCSRY